MFCPHCGQQNIDNAMFCTLCGKGITAYPTPYSQSDYQAQKASIRRSELAVLTDVYNHFAQKETTFALYDRVCKILPSYVKEASYALLIWGCILSCFGLFLLLGCLATGDHEILPQSQFLITLPGIIMIVGGAVKVTNYNKKREYYQQEYCRLSTELCNHYDDYPDCPIGPEYTNPVILGILCDIINSGRADTIKESLNIFANTANMRDIKKYLHNIEQNTAHLNRRLGVNTFFVSANFLNRR